MTDNDIIKALECCENAHCRDCAYFQEDLCGDRLREDAHKLINRQKAKIERLQEQLGKIGEHSLLLIQNARTEAIKEFADRLEEHFCDYDLPNYYYFRAVDEETINEIVKEMVGEME